MQTFVNIPNESTLRTPTPSNFFVYEEGTTDQDPSPSGAPFEHDSLVPPKRNLARTTSLRGFGDQDSVTKKLSFEEGTADQDPSPSGAHFEHESLVPRKPKLAFTSRLRSLVEQVTVSKKLSFDIFDDFDNVDGGDSGVLTPAELLSGIEIFEKMCLQHLNKLKRTPDAKKAEREKRIKTLMSMR